MLPEAIILATAGAIEAACNMALEAMRGQTPEQKAKIWQWWIEDVERWRKFWGIDK